ncbi:MAG: 50S ribosomal protein L17 [Proteobacteria bacterium]|nr:50S ribosomal protein L17 [Pseudomonadota bacterium]
MRHRKAGRNLGRNSSHRKAMMRNMVTSLFRHEQLETTDAKAKELRPIAEKMITLAKRGDLHSRRQALSFMRDKGVVHKLFAEVNDRYADRQGGYLRTIKKGYRKGDGAPVSVMQLLAQVSGERKDKKKAKAAGSGSASDSKSKSRMKGKGKGRPGAKKREEGRGEATVDSSGTAREGSE